MKEQSGERLSRWAMRTKNRPYVGFFVSREIFDALNQWAEETDRTRSHLLRNIIKKALAERERQERADVS